MRSTVIAVAFLFVFAFASVSHAAKLDTSFQFSTIETPHFSIHFHQGLEPLARKAASMAEDAYGKLVREYLWVPEEKTQLVLIDDSDFTNGLAVTIPYNTIYVQVAPPSLASTLGEYDDWLREVITHEYAHIVTSDPARGYSRVMRNIFGKPLPILGDPFTEAMFIVAAPPNTFLPRWWHEGGATWAESEFTGEGRGKGTFFDMVFRSAVAENHLPRVDEINGDPPYWPDGHMPYMFGYRLQKYIADTYGKEALGKLSIAHSGRFPYLISAPPEDLFRGKNYRQLYADMLWSLQQEQSQKIKALAKIPFTPLTLISKGGENLSYPRYSPDGSRIAFTREAPNDHTRVVITDSTGKTEIATFRRQYSEGSLCWSPDGKSIYFTQAEINRGFDVYQDLYVYDLTRHSVKRLTHKQRLSDVDISPDGRFFATVVSSRGSQNLALIQTAELEKKELAPRTVTDFALQRVSSPRWSPDGRSIAYALRDNAGHSSMRMYDLATGSDTALFTISHSVDYPVWSRDGSAIFYISDETGVFNLFAYDLKSGKSYQVTHLLTGALQPDLSADGRTVTLSSYTSYGFNISAVEVDRAKWSEKRGPSVPGRASSTEARSEKTGTESAPTRATTATKGAEGAASGDTASVSGDTTAIAASHYSPFKTLYPHFWLPRISGDGSDRAVLGAFTAGADVLGYNSYALSADYSPGRNRGYYNLFYDNDYFYPTVSLRSHIEPFLYSDLDRRGDYWELNKSFSAEAAVPINFLESRYLFRVGYQLLDEKALSDLDANGDFNGIRVFQGRRDNIFAGITFDDRLKYPYSISHEEGRTLSFLYRRFAKELGSDQNLSEYTAEYEEYIRIPYETLKHHVLYLRASGGWADGDLQYGQQAFQIGGPPSDLNPYPLRGYPQRFSTGKYVVTGTAEYRAPLFYPMHGAGTAPFFTEKVHGAVFVDAGEVWDDQDTFNANKVDIGAGFEARVDVTVGYWLKITPALGFAHGFNRGGENQIYLTLYLNL